MRSVIPPRRSGARLRQAGVPAAAAPLVGPRYSGAAPGGYLLAARAYCRVASGTKTSKIPITQAAV